MKAIVIQPDGKATLENPTTLEDFQKLVGGDIESVNWNESVTAYVNEDGKMLGLPLNSRATTLAHHTYKIGLAPDDCIVGPLVLVGMVDAEGIDTDVPEHLIDKIVGITIDCLDSTHVNARKLAQGAKAWAESRGMSPVDAIAHIIEAVLGGLANEAQVENIIGGLTQLFGCKVTNVQRPANSPA